MDLNVHLVENIQLLCTLPTHADFIVKLISQTCQWIMTLYAADPDMVISPPAIVILASIVYLFAILDIAMDVWFPRDRRGV